VVAEAEADDERIKPGKWRTILIWELKPSLRYPPLSSGIVRGPGLRIGIDPDHLAQAHFTEFIFFRKTLLNFIAKISKLNSN